MKKIMLIVLVLGLVGVAGTRPASAQNGLALVKVPFDFIVGDKVLPAGSYRITPDTQDPSTLIITGTQNKVSAAFASTGWSRNVNPMDPQAHVAFKNVDGHMFLWQVSTPGRDAREIAISKVEAERTLAKLNLVPADHADTAK